MDSIENFFYFWRIPKRRLQMQSLGLTKYYNQFLHRLHESYIHTFIIIHVLACTVHIGFLVGFVKEHDLKYFDITIYTISLLLTFVPLYLLLKRGIGEQYLNIIITSIIPLFIFILADLTIPIIYFESNNSKAVRPVHGDYVLCIFYIFMPIFEIFHVFCCGITISGCYIFVLISYSYRNDYFIINKIISEFIYLLSINLFGVYFRLMRQIAIIEIFFDRWDLIKQTVICKYERDQEKKLLLSIIPIGAAKNLLTDVKNRIQLAQESPDPELALKNFKLKSDKQYIYYHNDVSILYADVVNYTYLTTTLEVKPLVETLNELFVKFDEAAVEYHCLRIKFLGDCCYCVSGMPERNRYHAKSCVELGLRLIRIIREVRIRRNVDIDMRIGVHSGNVYAGIIGSAKWQYDIWSKDVNIANRLESTGVTGVHVSKYTLTKLNNEYEYEDGPITAKENEFLIKNEITETFLIIPKKDDIESNIVEPSITPHENSNKNNYLVSIVQQFNLVIEESKRELEIHIQQMADFDSTLYYIKNKIQGNKNQRLKISPIFLIVKNMKLEKKFWKHPDVLLKYSCLTALLIFFGIANFNYRIQFLLGGVILLFWIGLLWYKPIWNKIWEPEYSSFSVPKIQQDKNKISNFIYNLHDKIIISLFWRIIIYLTVVLSIFVAIIIQLSECEVYSDVKSKEEKDKRQIKTKVCFHAWVITHNIILEKCISCLFVEIPFVCKFIFDGLITTIATILIFWKYSYIYEYSTTSTVYLNAKYSHLYAIVISCILLNLMQRQTEVFLKTDFVWKTKLQSKKEASDISRKTCKMLIENMLPAHVAAIYILNIHKSELYTETYENVAIMFATIKNYDIEIVGLQVLDKIFCEFDEKINSIYAGPFKIEKIKVVGLTYMAACGLHPGFARDLSLNTSIQFSNWTKIRRSLGNNFNEEQYSVSPNLNVFVMTEFAVELMRTFNKFNIEYASKMEISNLAVLRIGISHGEVMGGVVGSSKPLYDVWGNTPNMASRMDTTGEHGRIQVTEETAKVLESFNIKCEYRGLTYVKGRNYIPTYFVGLNDKFEYIKKKDYIPLPVLDTIQTFLAENVTEEIKRRGRK